MIKKVFKIICIIFFILLALLIVAFLIYNNPKIVVKRYFYLINNGSYSDLKYLVNLPENYSVEDFINRNKNIYTGIDAENIKIKINNAERENKVVKVSITNSMKIKGQNIEFDNIIKISKDGLINKIDWNSNIIFPELDNNYKVRVRAVHAKRGELIDRNDKKLAYYGEISNIGIVPAKFDVENDTEKVANILKMSADSINKKLSKYKSNDDIFLSIKKVSKDDIELKEKLLEIPGIKISSSYDRVYPYKDSTAHITGYVSSITAEELEELKDKGYSSTSVLGKVGLEKTFEDRLRGKDGIGVYIEDENGKVVKKVIETEAIEGENIKLTIDVEKQVKLYNHLKDEQGFFVVMNPKTGEILSLVSTPSYDPNKFIFGISTEDWNEIINSEGKPLYSKFLSSWCPGSTMKPLTGAIGLSSEKLNKDDEFPYSGLAWKRDNWKDHEITTLTSYGGKKNLKNALIYSDNIYFAQATLHIGEETFTDGLDKLLFNKDIGFELSTSKSQYSNEDTIKGEAVIADSGYGQGQVLVNPIHMASIYSAFSNNGNMVKPYLEYSEDKKVEYLVENAFTEFAANEIKECLIEAVENPNGTGHDVKVNGITIAGKTGTAELKATKESEGDTLGWFDCFTLDQEEDESLLIISMAKNKTSGFLKQIIKTLFE